MYINMTLASHRCSVDVQYILCTLLCIGVGRGYWTASSLIRVCRELRGWGAVHTTSYVCAVVIVRVGRSFSGASVDYNRRGLCCPGSSACYGRGSGCLPTHVWSAGASQPRNYRPSSEPHSCQTCVRRVLGTIWDWSLIG